MENSDWALDGGGHPVLRHETADTRICFLYLQRRLLDALRCYATYGVRVVCTSLLLMYYVKHSELQAGEKGSDITRRWLCHSARFIPWEEEFDADWQGHPQG